MELSYHRYGLKLRGAAGGNARSGRRVLEGFLIRVEGGYGCVQPWPELGDETLEEQWRAVRSGGSTRLLDRARACASADGAARRAGRSLFEGMAVPRSHATVTGDADFAALRTEGFTVVKLKGGRDWRAVLERMRAAVAAGLRVRVDFNGTLEARAFLDFAEAAEDVGNEVDFVEDPVPYAPAVWEKLREETGWGLALDWIGEGLREEGGFDVRVLKPAADSMARRAEPVVVTGYMDHPLGQAFAAWEAGCYGGRQEAAGLLTHRLFEADAFTERLAGAGPDWRPPGGTGLGFDDLLKALPWVSLGSSGGGSAGRKKAGRVLRNPRDPLPDGGPELEPGQVGFTTSGSTGVPAVIVHTEASLEASSVAVNAWLAARAEDVWLRVLPDFHVGGYQIHTRAALSGSRVVVDAGKWDAARFAARAAAEGVTLTSLVPAQVVDLVRLGLRSPEGMRAVVVGGGALEEDFRRRALALGWPVLTSYGATEAGSQVATVLPGNAAWEGVPVPGLELLPHWEGRMVEDGGADGAGLLELRGPALGVGKFVRTGQGWAWQRLTDPAGWWRTSDRVFLSGRSLRFAGRADRRVKVLGELVSLEGVERGLTAAGLRAGTFVVVAVPEERRGTELVLVLEDGAGASDSGAAAAAVAAYENHAPPFARLGRFILVAPGGLPRSPLGKIRLGEAAALIPPRAVP